MKVSRNEFSSATALLISRPISIWARVLLVSNFWLLVRPRRPVRSLPATMTTQ